MDRQSTTTDSGGGDRNIAQTEKDSVVPRRGFFGQYGYAMSRYLVKLGTKVMGVEIDPSLAAAVQIFSLFGFSLIAILAATVFGLVNLAEGELMAGISELAFSFVVAISAMLYRLHRRIEIASSVVLLGVIAIMLMLIIQGGIAGSGAFWAFTFPIAAFLLTNQRLGFLWSILLIIAIGFIGIGDASGLIDSYYDPITIRQLAAALITTTLIVMVYELVAARSRETAIARTKDLRRAYDRLQAETAARQVAQSETTHLLEEANQRNTVLERLKLAMANLLEDVQQEKVKAEQISTRDEALLANIGESILTTDINGIITMANEQAAKLLKMSKGKLVGTVIFDAYQCIRDDRVILSDERVEFIAFVQRHTISEDYILLRQDKTKFEAALTASPLMIQGTPRGTVLTIRNRTKEAEIDKAKTEFVSLASHQLRTPLTAINWYVEMISADKKNHLSEEHRSYLNEIQKASQRMVSLVGSLLNVSRIDLGTFLVEPVPTDAIEVAETVIKELAATIKRQKVKVNRNFDDKLPKLNLDPKLIYIIFQNLLSNAVKYTPAGGTITLTITLRLKHLIIEVSDTGLGIPKNQQSKIFTKLFRADNVTSKETDGTGLGLYVVKAIVKAAGGTIGFVSEENKGTTFTVKLPKTGMKKREGTKVLNTE